MRSSALIRFSKAGLFLAWLLVDSQSKWGTGFSAKSMRVFSISDLHTDYNANMRWVELLSDDEYRDDTLLVAGDLSHDSNVLLKTLALLRHKFQRVFFCPGNHDVWLSRSEKLDCSIDKLDFIMRECTKLGVSCRPTWVQDGYDCSSNMSIGKSGGGGLWIVPVLSWYHSSFDCDPDIPRENLPCDLPGIRGVIVDFQRCRWPNRICESPPADVGQEDALAKYIDWLNSGPDWDAFEKGRRADEAVVSFSHFLPRVELIPEKRYLLYPLLPKVVGSKYLQQRVNLMRPDVHIFGHTHFAWDSTIAGIRYIQTPLSYPRERSQRLTSLTLGNFPQSLFCLWRNGKFTTQQHSDWSDYYRSHARDPGNTELASWVVNRLKAFT